jgi:hypothetical protein
MEENKRITYIYGLYEVGKEDEIRYVGKSDNPHSRLISHKSSSLRKSNNTHKSCWIRSVYKNGGEIGFKIIEEVNYDNWSDREIFWISQYDNLTNLSPGGETGITGKLFDIEYIECKKWINENYPLIKKWNPIINKLPDFIPKRPYIVYLNSGWTGWVDFIGIDLSPKKYINYREAKEYVIKLKLNSSREWFEYWQMNHNDDDDFPMIPRSPNNIYDEWEGWTIFLNSKQKSNDLFINKLSYTELCKYVSEKMSNIKTSREYRKYVSENNLTNIPICPNRSYKDEWISWNSFLNKKEFIKQKEFYSYEKCKEIVKLNNIKSNKEFRLWVKNTKGIPKSPNTYFKEWVDWFDFLGKKE